MSEPNQKIQSRLPGTNFYGLSILAAVLIYLVALALKQPQLGIFIGVAAWLGMNKLVTRQVITMAIAHSEALIAAGRVSEAANYIFYTGSLYRSNRRLYEYLQTKRAIYKEFNPNSPDELRSANSNGTEVELESTSETNTLPIDLDLDNSTEATNKPPQLSRLAVLILTLLPFVFLPSNPANYFTAIGVWVTVAVGLMGINLALNSKSAWDRRIAILGLSVVALSVLVQFGLQLANNIPGPDPGGRFQLETTEITWVTKLMGFIVLMLSVILHECAHGIVAFFSGDSTAKRAGRISFNPVNHIDLFGTIFLPLMMAFLPGGVIFGWAKPVPVNPTNFRNHRKGWLAVSLSGVASNLFLALFCSSLLMLLGVLLHFSYPGMTTMGFAFPWKEVIINGVPNPVIWVLIIQILKAGIFTNLVLFFLNILPIPPLDGYGVIESIMPVKIQGWLGKFRGAGSLILLALIIFNLINVLLIPGIYVGAYLTDLAGQVAKLR